MRGLFWLMSVLALGCFILAIAGGPAQAEHVKAYFDDGNTSTKVDGYPGTAGNGWAGPWVKKQFHGTVTATVVATPTVVDPPPPGINDNYLVYNVTGTYDGPRGILSRDFGYVAGTNEDGIDLTKPYTVTYKYRIDHELDGEDAFNTAADEFYICEDSAPTSAATPTATASWLIDAWGTVTTEGVHYWLVNDGNGDGTGTQIQTTVPLRENVVVDMSVRVFPATNTWDVIIDDPDYHYERTGLGYIGATTPGRFKVGARVYTPEGGESNQFSFDTLEIIPEPSTLVLLLGLGLLGLIRRWR